MWLSLAFVMARGKQMRRRPVARRGCMVSPCRLQHLDLLCSTIDTPECVFVSVSIYSLSVFASHTVTTVDCFITT